MRLETDSPAVQLLTIHGSKGLEFPVVFCPFLWSVRQRNLRETRCHAALVRTDSEWILDTGSQRFAEHRTLALQQEDEEEHRKLYVALTRPRHRLYLGIAPVAATQNARNGADSSPLAKLPGLGLEHRPLQEWESALDALPFLQVLSAPAAFQNAQRVPAEHAGSSAVSGVPYDPEASVGLPSRSGEQPGLIQLRFGGVPHRVSSFSALSRTSHDTPSAKEHNPGIEEDDVSAGADLLEPLNLSGTELGTWIHGVLEDYLGNRKSAVESVGTVGQPALPLLQTILSTPIPLPDGHPVTLESVRDSCVTEMQFHLPVGQLDPKKLSAALLADPAVSGNTDRRFWAEELATLGFHEFTGFLQGFIDLIFEHEGRWYVMDYKSNRLEGYNPARLEQAMLDSKYLLQARIYAFALHQHLSVHLPLYDPTKHLGGVLYLFLRGMPKAGFWSETPSAAALQSFATLFSKN
jgi:exodeoxyribonuclease V beta subunit